MSRYRQTMREALEQVRQQFTEGHSDKDFKPYSDWKKTSGGMYPRFKHTQKGEIQVDRYGEWLHSDKSGKTIAFYRNHFPKTNTTGGTSMKLTDYLKKINEEVINEVSDHEISMARGELEAIADKATQLAGALQGKSDEGNPLEAWVQSKITKAKDYINSVSDYLTYDPSMKQNEETLDEKTYGWTLVSKAKDLAKKFKDNITKAIDEIEKLEKGLSKNPTVDAELRKYNENLEEKYTVVITKKDGTTMELGKYNTSAEAQRYVDQYGKGAKVKKEEVELDEIDEKISDIFKANKEGESIDDIAKRLKLSTSMVKKLIGEDLNEQDEQETDPDKIALAKEKDTDVLEKQLKAAQGQINVLKQKIENEKNKAVKPLPNPETGEVPLTIGIAHKVLRDMKDKEAEEKKQKEASKQIQNMAKGGEETKLESFTKKYLSHLNESEASDKAKAMGLDYMSFGRYGKDGKVTHKSSGGTLTALSKKDQEKEKDTDKPVKPKTKTTGNIKNPDDTKTTSGQIKKEILKKIDDEDIENDPSILPEFEDEFLALADDLKGSGDKETADKILSAVMAAGEDDTDTAAKIDDMMNALQGKPDLNTAKQKELSKMTSLYTDAKYSSKNFQNFVSDTSSMISKMGELADAGSMDSDAYGPGIRSDAMVELVSTASEIQDKIKDMDMNDDIKIDINAALSTLTDKDTDEYTEEGHIYMAIEKLKYSFKKLNKQKSKTSSGASKTSSGAKGELKKAIKNASEPGADFDIRDYDKIQKMAKKAGDKKALDILDKLNKAHKSKDGSEVSYQYVDLYKHLTEEVKNEVSDRLKLKVLKKKIKQYKDKVFKKTMSTVKSPLFADKEIEEALEIKEFTSQMIDRLKKSFSTAPKKISPEQANKLSKHLDRIDLNDLRKLVKANIPFVSTVARNKIYKKTGKFEETNLEDRRLYVEAIAGLQKKADKSGMPYSILKKVYDRGMAAWKSGHRPGASQQQWAFARVNSFVTKSSGTWGGADKDLAKQVKGK